MIYTINTLPSLSSTASTADEIILYGIENSITGKLTVQELASTMGLSTPIDITKGGTGATTASNALSNLGALPLSGGTLTGNLSIKMSSVTRGTTPSGNNYMRYNMVDSAGTQLGLWEIGVLSNGNAVMNTWLMGHHTSSEQYGGLQITKAVGNTNNAVLSFNANTGLCSASSFSGNGASLTSLNASNISSGTLSTGHLPTVPIAKGGTGATDRLNAFKNLTAQDVGSSAQYFVTLTQNWATAGYSSVANACAALGIKCTRLWNGSMQSGSATFSFGGYNAYIVLGKPSGGSFTSLIIPAIALGTSDTQCMLADESSYISFKLKYSGSTGTITYVTRTSGSNGVINYIYGIK